MHCLAYTTIDTLSTPLTAVPLRCKTWACHHCAPINARKVRQKILAGRPYVFLTLTCNPVRYDNPTQAAHDLRRAATDLMRELKRRYGRDKIAYFLIWERTKRGYPHAHILMRAPYIEQAWLSRFMDRAIQAPIVDIRFIHDPKQVARYVAKYVTKDLPAYFGLRRYSYSRNWLLVKRSERLLQEALGVSLWARISLPIERIITAAEALGYRVRLRGHAVLIDAGDREPDLTTIARLAWHQELRSFRPPAPLTDPPP